jgi:hypothetical protein
LLRRVAVLAHDARHVGHPGPDGGHGYRRASLGLAPLGFLAQDGVHGLLALDPLCDLDLEVVSDLVLGLLHRLAHQVGDRDLRRFLLGGLEEVGSGPREHG